MEREDPRMKLFPTLKVGVMVLFPKIDNYRTDTFANLFSESIVIFQNQGSRVSNMD